MSWSVLPMFSSESFIVPGFLTLITAILILKIILLYIEHLIFQIGNKTNMFIIATSI